MNKVCLYSDASNSKESAKGEVGAILVLLSICLATLMAAVAAAIDINAGLAAREEAQYFARVSALASLEEYFATDGCDQDPPLSDSDRFDCRVQKAFDKAKGDVSNPLNSLSFQNVTSELAQQPDQGGAHFESGTWIEDESYCGSAEPCFRPSQSGELAINSVRITGTYYPGFSTVLAHKFFGIQLIPLSVSATASVVPRHGCFLIDTSPSIVDDTHYLEYAYFNRYLGDNSFDSNFHLDKWHDLQHHRPANRPDDQLVDPTYHYPSDFRRKYVMGDVDYSAANYPFNPAPGQDGKYGAGDGLWAMVDAFNAPGNYSGPGENAAGVYTGPEPLGTVFKGLQNAMQFFLDNAVAGDKACIIFYDSRITWPRVFTLTKDIAGLKNQFNFDIASPIEEDIDSSSSIGSVGRERTIRQGLLPMVEIIDGDIRTGTDMRAALEEAIYQFNQDDQNKTIPVSRFVVHIGDGLSNCIKRLPGQVGYKNRCVQDYDRYVESIAEVESVVKNQYAPNNIPLHLIVTGAQVGPHTVDIEKLDGDGNGTGQCLSDKEFRALAKPDPFGFVRGHNGIDPDTSFNRMSPSFPYYDSVKNLYRFAVMTRGLYGPIRPAGVGCSGGRVACNPGTRQKLDPYCRDQRGQVRDFMREIVGHNPYTVVDVG